MQIWCDVQLRPKTTEKNDLLYDPQKTYKTYYDTFKKSANNIKHNSDKK